MLDILRGWAFTWSSGERDRASIKYALATLVEIGRQAGSDPRLPSHRAGYRAPPGWQLRRPVPHGSRRLPADHEFSAFDHRASTGRQWDVR